MGNKPKKSSRPKRKVKGEPVLAPIVSHYSEALGDQICDLLCDGKTLNAICKRTPGLPSERTIRRWAMDPQHPFSPKYVRAREIGYMKMGDDLIDLTDAVSEDSDAVAKVRVQLDARKWFLARALPKIWGDKVTSELTGKDGEGLFVRTESTLETARWIALILSKGSEAASAERAASSEA